MLSVSLLSWLGYAHAGALCNGRRGVTASWTLRIMHQEAFAGVRSRGRSLARDYSITSLYCASKITVVLSPCCPLLAGIAA